MDPSASGPIRRAGEEEIGIKDKERFALELEFVQCLANPNYLNWLAQNRYLEDPAFLNFLKYLQYWKQPEYAKYVIYPHSLQFLDLLQTEEFRAAIANPNYKELVHSQQFFTWQHYRANRVKEASTAGADIDLGVGEEKEQGQQVLQQLLQGIKPEQGHRP